MQFAIEQDILAQGLRSVSGVVERRNIQDKAILANVLLKIVGNTLQLITTDLDLEIISTCPLIDQGVAGAITVSFRKLNDIFRVLPKGRVDFSLNNNAILLIKSGPSNFSLATMPATEYPKVMAINELTTIALPRKELLELISATALAMAEQDVRHFLNGMLLEITQDSLTAVAADGHRLAVKQINLAINNGDNIRVIVPRKAILELLKFLSEDQININVAVGTNFVRFDFENKVLTARLFTGDFPDHKLLVTNVGNNIVIADSQELKAAFNRAAVLCDDKSQGIGLSFKKNKIDLFATNNDHDKIEDVIAVEYDGIEVEIGLNVKYLLEIMDVINDKTVQITMQDANSRVLIQGYENSTAKYIIMPMRI